MTNSFDNKVTGGQAILSAATRPATANDYMVFDGTKSIRFSDNSNNWRVSAPYSVELEVSMNAGAEKWIATLGEGFGAGWPEWAIIQRASTVTFTSSFNNSSATTDQVLLSSYKVAQWYRLGFMFYAKENGDTHFRGYVNDIQVFDVAAPAPYDSPNGMAIGSDWTFNTSTGARNRIFNGRIRNVSIARSLFWPI